MDIWSIVISKSKSIRDICISISIREIEIEIVSDEVMFGRSYMYSSSSIREIIIVLYCK
jgi:hypothetical protein